MQVLGMLSAEGLITLERVTLDGTKIKANAGGNTFRRKEKLEAHLELAREQVRRDEGTIGPRGGDGEAAGGGAAAGGAATRRAVWRQRCVRWSACRVRKKHDRKQFVARASSTDPEAHVMRNGEGGTVPSYNVQLLTDSDARAGREC